MKKYKLHIVWAIVVVIVAVGGFFWGKSTATVSRAGFAGTSPFGSSTRRFPGAGGTTGSNFATGQISEIDSSSITLQLPTGSSEVVFYSSSTSVTEPTTVSVSNLSVGTNVMIGGTSNADGSLTATTIQVRPTNPSSTRPTQ